MWLHRHIETKHPEYQAKLNAAREREADMAHHGRHPAKHIDHSSHTFLPNSGSANEAGPAAANGTTMSGDEAGPAATAYNYDVHPENEASPALEDWHHVTFTSPDVSPRGSSLPPDERIPTNFNPYFPFSTEEEFGFAKIVIEGNLSAEVVDTFLKEDCGFKDEIRASLRSYHHIRPMLDVMRAQRGESLSRESQDEAPEESSVWPSQGPGRVEFPRLRLGPVSRRGRGKAPEESRVLSSRGRGRGSVSRADTAFM